MKNGFFAAAVIALFTGFPSTVSAHGGDKDVKLHVNPQWKECSFQLDASLTQQAWHEFTEEAGLVSYFRSLTDAEPMGAGNYEFSLLQWATAFDDTKAAWNDTFVHPDSTHWLKAGERLAFPGLSLRTGITDRVDIAAYWIKNPGANYGFWGGQVQYNLVRSAEERWAASARLGFNSLYGPDDVAITVYGIDLVASKEFTLHEDWISVAPYAGVSSYLSRSEEKSSVVNLRDENIMGFQGMLGAVTHLSFVKLAVEYNVAVVHTLSFKIGFGF